jgi:hypothetical protein
MTSLVVGDRAMLALQFHFFGGVGVRNACRRATRSFASLGDARPAVISLAIHLPAISVLRNPARLGRRRRRRGIRRGVSAPIAGNLLVKTKRLSRSKIGRLRRRGRPVSLPEAAGLQRPGQTHRFAPMLILDLLRLGLLNEETAQPKSTPARENARAWR